MRAGLAAALTACLAFAAPAVADTILHGTTTPEDVPIKLVVGEFGNATSFQVGSFDVECRHGTLSTGKITFAPFDISDPGSFHDKSKDRSRHGALRFKSKSTVQGSQADDGSWSGELTRRTKVFKHREKIDTCGLATTWTAT